MKLPDGGLCHECPDPFAWACWSGRSSKLSHWGRRCFVRLRHAIDIDTPMLLTCLKYNPWASSLLCNLIKLTASSLRMACKFNWEISPLLMTCLPDSHCLASCVSSVADGDGYRCMRMHIVTSSQKGHWTLVFDRTVLPTKQRQQRYDLYVLDNICAEAVQDGGRVLWFSHIDEWWRQDQ